MRIEAWEGVAMSNLHYVGGLVARRRGRCHEAAWACRVGDSVCRKPCRAALEQQLRAASTQLLLQAVKGDDDGVSAGRVLPCHRMAAPGGELPERRGVARAK